MIEINEKQYELECTGYTLLLYKEEFKEDFFEVISNLGERLKDDYLIPSRLLYIMIKSADDTSFPSYIHFMKSIKDISILLRKETIDCITECLSRYMQTTVESKSKKKATKKTS